MESPARFGRNVRKAEQPRWTKCATCGADLYVKRKGRTRDYCSAKCRQKAYRIRRELES